MKSIYLRNFLATALLVFFCFLIIGASFFFLGRSYLISNTRDRMSACADEVIRPGAAECFRNPRAKPAKLRWAIRA